MIIIEDAKVVGKAALAFVVSAVNFSLSGLNELMGILVAVLTSIYLVTQILKNLKNKKS